MFADQKYTRWEAITTSDTADLTPFKQIGRLTDAIHVGVAGTITAVMSNGDTAQFTAPVGILHIACRRINATGTAASGLVALYWN